MLMFQKSFIHTSLSVPLHQTRIIRNRWWRAAKRMRTTVIFAGLLLSWFRVAGQSLPAIKFDSTVRTSELYSWRYDKEREVDGHWSTYWVLKNDLKLYSGQTAPQPTSNNSALVGSWRIQKDSLVLTISKPKRLGYSNPFSIKYRIFQVEWTTTTGFSEKDTGEGLVLRSVAIILCNKPDFNMIELLEKLNKYVMINYKPIELGEDEESIRDWNTHNQVEELVRQYFNSETIPIGIKQYRNKNLWTRF